MPQNPVWIKRRLIHRNEGLVGEYVDMQHNMWPPAQKSSLAPHPQNEYEDYDPEDYV
jgi:hypothetical protein